MPRILATRIAVTTLCSVLLLTIVFQGAWRNFDAKSLPEIGGAAILGIVVFVAVGVGLFVSWLRLRREATRALTLRR